MITSYTIVLVTYLVNYLVTLFRRPLGHDERKYCSKCFTIPLLTFSSDFMVGGDVTIFPLSMTTRAVPNEEGGIGLLLIRDFHESKSQMFSVELLVL